MEAIIEPDSVTPGSSGIVLTTANKSRRNFVLEQQGRQLWFGIRMKGRGEGAFPKVLLFELAAGRPTHVVVTYEPGHLVAYRDGELVTEDKSLKGSFFPWRQAPLIFGSDWNGEKPWHGKLEGVAIYSRVLESEEIGENFLRYQATLAARPELERWLVEATLETCSKTPTLAEIEPYREALSVCHYRVGRVVSGKDLGAMIRVAKWSILDGQRIASMPDVVAPTSQMTLTRFADNPQLGSLFLSDTLEGHSNQPLYYLERP